MITFLVVCGILVVAAVVTLVMRVLGVGEEPSDYLAWGEEQYEKDERAWRKKKGR